MRTFFRIIRTFQLVLTFSHNTSMCVNYHDAYHNQTLVTRRSIHIWKYSLTYNRCFTVQWKIWYLQNLQSFQNVSQFPLCRGHFLCIMGLFLYLGFSSRVLGVFFGHVNSTFRKLRFNSIVATHHLSMHGNRWLHQNTQQLSGYVATWFNLYMHEAACKWE